MILYFSATGNSKYCAERLREATKEPLVCINQYMKQGKTDIDCNNDKRIGIISPIYDMGMSWAVEEFLRNAHFYNISEDCYIYAVFTCGKSCGYASETIKDILIKKDLKLSAAFAVCMPDTYIPMFPLASKEEQNKLLQQADSTLADVIADVQNYTSVMRLTPKMPKPIIKLIRSINIPKQKKTDKFWVKDSCTGCGLCEKVCPKNIIRLQNNRPVWEKDDCACCLGCIHRCPAHAIQYGQKTEQTGRYVNPNVTL